MGNKIILCVDDEETILSSLEMDLSKRSEGYQIEMATNGIEALKLLKELLEEGLQLAVVISDHIMPEMKGDELLTKIHKEHPTAVKILLTGQSQIKGVTNAINNADLYRYIAKPWDKGDLVLTVTAAIKKFEADQLLLEKEKIIIEMNRKLLDSKGKDGETYNPEDKLSDEELYDQIFFSRFFQSLDTKEKKWFALASIGLITADKKMTKTEMNYLNSIVRSDRDKGTVEHYIELIKRKTKPNLNALRIPGEKKYRLLTYLSQILISSKHIGQIEEEYFFHIGNQLNVTQKETNDCLKIVKHKILGNYMGFKLKEHLTKEDPLLTSNE